jgi:hypothetical protein
MSFTLQSFKILRHLDLGLINNITILVWLQKGFGLVIGFIEHLQNVTTSNDYALTVLHTSQSLSPQSVTLFTNCCLVAASNGGRSPFLWVPELSPDLSYQLLTTTEPQLSYDCKSNLSCLKYLDIGHRKHRSSVAVQLLLACLLGLPRDLYSVIA